MGGNLRDIQIEYINEDTKGGICNWNEFCRHSAIETFASSDISKISKKLEEIIECNNEGLIDRSNILVRNLLQSANNALTKKNFEEHSHAALVKSIDGNFVQHLPTEEKIEMLKSISLKKLRKGIFSVKKK